MYDYDTMRVIYNSPSLNPDMKCLVLIGMVPIQRTCVPADCQLTGMKSSITKPYQVSGVACLVYQSLDMVID